MARVLPYPWSLIAPRGAGVSLSLEDCETADPLNVEVLTLFSRTDGEPLPVFATHRKVASLFTNGVLQNLSALGRPRLGVLSVPPLPHEKSDRWFLRFGGEECAIPVCGALRRASAWDDPAGYNAAEVSLRDTIDLLSGYFIEAISLTHDKAFSDFHGQAVARLDWATIWDRWKEVSTRAEPRTARVVDIALSYVARIRDVCERPRRMLVRQREALPVGRVQEIDAVCLRNLIQRPGRTLLEKAGARQEIMAITRRETVDTAENRVIRDFIRLCQHRARAYERENGHSRKHKKVEAVVCLRQACERFEVGSPMATVGPLVGVVRPNYVLQKDRRYHPLWVQYDKLRREEEAVDNIWAWGRCLWAEFVRGVVIAFLFSKDGRNNCDWQPDGNVSAYLRAEHRDGCFTPALSVSSRWARRGGKARMFVVHPAHAHLCPGLEELLPRLGAELSLVVYPLDEQHSLRPQALLCIYSVLSLRTDATQREAMATSLSASFDLVAQQNPGLNIRGLLLRGDWLGDQPPQSPRFGRLDYLVAPAGGRFWFHEFSVHLAVLLEELVG